MSELSSGDNSSNEEDFLRFVGDQLGTPDDAVDGGIQPADYVLSFEAVKPQGLYEDPELVNDEIAWQLDQSGVHDVPIDPETPPGYFTETDKIIGTQAWETYYSEIMADGTSLRQAFDVGPDTMHLAEEREEGDLADIDRFVEQVLEVGGMVRNMTRFIGRPITEVSVDETEGSAEVSELVIREQDVRIQQQFHGALVDYVGALLQHGPRSPEVRSAARSVARIVQPGLWDNSRTEGIEQARPLYSPDVARYFAALMNQPHEDGRNELGQ